MRNPFVEMADRHVELDWEEVEGSFACQERGCFKVSGKARYLEEEKLLTWKCSDEHINKIEGFHIG